MNHDMALPEPDVESPDGDLLDQQWARINDWFDTPSIQWIPDGVPGAQPTQPPSIH
jgi:hypothetical protein